MNGLEKWTEQEKHLPKIASRPAEPTLRSQQSSMMSIHSGTASILSKQSTAFPGHHHPHPTKQNHPSGGLYVPSWASNATTATAQSNVK